MYIYIYTTSSDICFHSGLLIFSASSKLSVKQKISQICNCRIWMNYSAICIHLWLNYLPLGNYSSLGYSFKITGRAIGKMWLAQDMINYPSSIRTLWCDNLPEAGLEFAATGHLDHLCRFSKSWCFGLGSVVFGGWMGGFQKTIFVNCITPVQLEYISQDVNLLGCWNGDVRFKVATE